MSITTLYRETCQELLKIGDSESFTIERATKGYYANHPDCFSMIPADFANYVLIKCKIYLNEVVIGLSEKYDIMPELSNSQDGIESEKNVDFTHQPFTVYKVRNPSQITTIIQNYITPFLHKLNDFWSSDNNKTEQNDNHSSKKSNHHSTNPRLSYSKIETIGKLASADVKPDNLYNKNFINWRSKTNDTSEWYTEVIANQLLSESRLRWLDEIKTITRMKGSYFVNEHSLNNIVVNDTKRREENMAKHILKDMKPFESVGLMIDYQVPLKNTSSDKAGKVDLVSFDYETNTIRLFELKNPDRYMKTPETLLRCVLESYTYLKTIDQNKLIKDLPEKLERVKEELIQNGHEELVKYATINNDNKLRIQAHILIAKDNLQHSKMIREDSNYHQKVVELMNKLGITPFIYEYDDINGSPIITKITKYN